MRWIVDVKAHPGVLILSGVLMSATTELTACAYAGVAHRQELPPERMQALMRAAGRRPRQRTGLDGEPPVSQVAVSYHARPLATV